MDYITKNSILIVDDETMNLEVLRGIFTPEYTLYMTRSGVSALEMAGKYIPDLILLDIVMPDINGFEVLQTLKTSEKTRDIPVIIISGLDRYENEEKGLEMGAADFIRKPFNTKIVSKRVRNHIQSVNQIREIKQYAHSMQLTLSKMEAIVNNFKGVIWSIDDEGVITSFNGQYLDTIGISPSFLVGKNIQVARAKNRHLDIIDNIEKTFHEGSQDWQSEVGDVIFHSHTTPLHDNDGILMGVVGSSYDVTELVRLHQELEAAVEAAESANISKSSFLARMSHEIRTPLNAVLGIAEIQLQNLSLKQDVKEAFARIFNSGSLLLGIINDILDISKIEAGKLELLPDRYDVLSMINDTVFLNMIRYENKPVEFILNVDENIPSALYGDELRIKQILNNILSNAFKYTDEGEVELAVNAQYEGDTVVVIFSVRDTGQGMTGDQLGKLFNAYSRFNRESSRKTEGTGLGMVITRNLVQLMNGEIFAESEAGKGSRFTVRLPQGKINDAVLGGEAVEKLRQFRLNYETKTKNIHIVREAIPYGKVLVVDDMDMNLYVTKGLLSLYGLQIDTALSGYEAIDKIKLNDYDLVFMDHMMPGMDGIETIREIRKLGAKYEKLPVIALTANAVSGVKEMFLDAGFGGFLSKPIPTQELDEIIKKWLSPDKLKPGAKAEAEDTNEIHDHFLDTIGKTGEIDPGIGLGNLLGDKGKYHSTLSMFHKKIMSECKGMSALLDIRDLKRLKISVHAMKAMLAIIGAHGLSEAALELEMAAQNNDVDSCVQKFPPFRERLLAVHQKLAVIFPTAEETPPPPAQTVENPQAARVLVVDDMDMILFVIRDMLLRYGLRVDTALNGYDAVEKARQNAYDLIFMDHLMPGMDGIETAAEIRKFRKELPIIVLTSNMASDAEAKYLTAGFNGFLSKPVAKPQLEETLKQWLPRVIT
jgi:PAS domain S-box-containing protein